MGKFKEYFERAKSSGLNETIKVPTFESKEDMLNWLSEVAKDADLDAVVARDDVYHPVTEDLFISAGDSLAELKDIVSTCEAWEAMDAREGWSPLMKKYLSKTTVKPERRAKEKAKDKEEFAKEERKTEGVANKYLKRLKEVEDDEKLERSWQRDKARREKEDKAKFKGMSIDKIKKAMESMGFDMAGDQLYELEQQKLSKEDMEDQFNQWAGSAAWDVAYDMYASRHDFDLDTKKEKAFLKSEGIEDVAGWAADYIHEGMQKHFTKRVK